MGLLLVLGVTTAVNAHVNRQVGPYTILVILVEEPTFEDNHAGFQFWVRRDQEPIVGLEHSIQAEATGHGQRDVLTVPPIGGAGFYVLDRMASGAAFDPLGGGPWSLHLWGHIGGTALDVQFAVTFPSYPRIGTPKAVTGAPAGSTGSGWSLLPALAVGAIGLLAAALVVARRVRSRLVPPTLAPRR